MKHVFLLHTLCLVPRKSKISLGLLVMCGCEIQGVQIEKPERAGGGGITLIDRFYVTSSFSRIQNYKTTKFLSSSGIRDGNLFLFAIFPLVSVLRLTHLWRFVTDLWRFVTQSYDRVYRKIYLLIS